MFTAADIEVIVDYVAIVSVPIATGCVDVQYIHDILCNRFNKR